MHGENGMGAALPLVSILPFAGLLLSIALLPALAPRFWHRRYPIVAIAWGLLFAIPFVAAFGGQAWHEILNVLLTEYVPFIVLLWGLFTVSGGIVLSGTLRATPALNTGLLLLGTALASIMGTTGAVMLLVRPLLRANAGRAHRTHVMVFFIFLVGNIGGSLTPLGDPPLFLGFLQGVPFFWTLRLLPHLLVASAALLAVFYLIDRRLHRREAAPDPAGRRREPLRVEGRPNILLLLGVLGAVLLSGIWRGPIVGVLGVAIGAESIARDLLILCCGALSLFLTPRRLHRANDFSWGPMREVAYLFAGIFLSIIPAFLMLQAGESGPLRSVVAGMRTPERYFWVTGLLSSFLDNAPTYLTFLATLLGRFYPGVPVAEAVPRLALEQAPYLLAVSVGAVFMGANTYIGNAPNLMVRAISEDAGVKMPSFFGFLFRWSLPILLPLFFVLGKVFF